MLNLSGWYDDAYGVEGAATNFNGLRQARSGQGGARTHLVLGPWVHGVPSATDGRTGELDFGPNAAFDYDEWVLDFHDHYLRGIANRFSKDASVRYFVMGANEWRDAGAWPPPSGPHRNALFRCGDRRHAQADCKAPGDSRIAQCFHGGPGSPGHGSS